MTDTTHATRVEPNLLRGCEIWATAADGGWTQRHDGIAAFGCGTEARAFNQMLVTAPSIAADVLSAAATSFDEGPFRVRFRDDLHGTLKPTLEAVGLERQGGIPTMTFSGHLGPIETPLRIERVTDEVSLTDHVRVVAEGFGNWVTETLGAIFTPRLLDNPDWFAWVGYEGQEPVATAQLVVHGGVAGLYYIATMESARGKGYGEALTRIAMREGFDRGCDLVSLQASSLGRPVYERIGFSILGEYITYVRPEDA
jgi:ribosomal protein S18 acetylase RimI-like enzyme